MNYTLKAKVHEICENVRDEYLLTALEENESISEKDILKMKKFLNENISRIEKMLVEEGYLELGKKIIEESFKTVAKNVGLAGLGAAAGALGIEHANEIKQAAGQAAEFIADKTHDLADKVQDWSGKGVEAQNTQVADSPYVITGETPARTPVMGNANPVDELNKEVPYSNTYKTINSPYVITGETPARTPVMGNANPVDELNKEVPYSTNNPFNELTPQQAQQELQRFSQYIKEQAANGNTQAAQQLAPAMQELMKIAGMK